jgi:hypothetical protein
MRSNSSGLQSCTATIFRDEHMPQSDDPLRLVDYQVIVRAGSRVLSPEESFKVIADSRQAAERRHRPCASTDHATVRHFGNLSHRPTRRGHVYVGTRQPGLTTVELKWLAGGSSRAEVSSRMSALADEDSVARRCAHDPTV